MDPSVAKISLHPAQYVASLSNPVPRVKYRHKVCRHMIPSRLSLLVTEYLVTWAPYDQATLNDEDGEKIVECVFRNILIRMSRLYI